MTDFNKAEINENCEVESYSRKINNYKSKTTQTLEDSYFVYDYNKYNKCFTISIIVIATGILMMIPFQEYTKRFLLLKPSDNVNTEKIRTFKKFWVYGRNVESGYLKNVFAVLDIVGYKNEDNVTDWDLLWAHDYPFRTLHSKFVNLQSHQKINKLPGSGYITNKVDLATSGLKYIPPAFRLPRDKDKLLEYSKKHPKVQFVQKSNDHRNIQIKPISEIDLNSEGIFVQEFVDKPFLINDHKFDIGIYTVITSIDPLRIYIYNDDVLLRFCPTKYKPFDSNNIDKYVVGDDYLPPWEVPAFKYYYNTLGFGMKASLNAYLQSKGKNPNVIWNQIEDSIRIVGLAKEQQIINVINKYQRKTNFFELMRFDFVVTEDLKVLLMEANMSPNLSSSHFPLNRLLFEQIIFNLFGLVGIAKRFKTINLMNGSHIEVADKNIMVFPIECNSSLCRSSCVPPICQLCRPCISMETKENIMEAYREHINKGLYKRIFPPPMEHDNIDLYNDLEHYSVENQLQHRWFQGKCLLDLLWCK